MFRDTKEPSLGGEHMWFNGTGPCELGQYCGGIYKLLCVCVQVAVQEETFVTDHFDARYKHEDCLDRIVLIQVFLVPVGTHPQNASLQAASVVLQCQHHL
jgi:hypothetical protein